MPRLGSIHVFLVAHSLRDAAAQSGKMRGRRETEFGPLAHLACRLPCCAHSPTVDDVQATVVTAVDATDNQIKAAALQQANQRQNDSHKQCLCMCVCAGLAAERLRAGRCVRNQLHARKNQLPSVAVWLGASAAAVC